MKTLPNGLPRYYADRVRHDNHTLRNSSAYDIIDRLIGHQSPIRQVPDAYTMERELARLNA